MITQQAQDEADQFCAHPNSVASLKDEIQQGHPRDRRAEILRHIGLCSFAVTDRMVCRALGYSDMNQVRPRITELLAMGKLRELGSQRCHHTGKTVRTVVLA